MGNLAQSCCTGNQYSLIPGTFQQAPGFCAGVSDDGCLVATVAPGWKGCACLDASGMPVTDHVCTVECVPPQCPLPYTGLDPTPAEWVTSAVPKQMFPPDPWNTATSVATGAPSSLR